MRPEKNNNRAVQEIMHDLGKIPPQAIELEEAVLGAMILDPECIETVASIIPPDAFYKDTHRLVCESIYKLKRTGTPVDLLTLVEELKRQGKLDLIGGPYFLTQLTTRVATAANVEIHTRIVLQKYAAREAIRIAYDAQEQAFSHNADIGDIIAEYQRGMDAIQELLVGKRGRSLHTIITETLDKIIAARENPATAFGIPTPLNSLNNLTNGWQNSDLIVLAGRPSRGKTAFALANVRSACEAGKSVAIFSLEMEDIQLMNRMIWSLGAIPEEAAGIIAKWKLEILDKGAVDLEYIISNSRLIKRRKGLDLIVIDYLGLMTLPKGENRSYQIGEVTHRLKALAKEMKIPVLLICQLSRDIEKRSHHRHQLSDLRESGDIEQDADLVLFVSRPIMDGVEQDKEGQPTDYLTVIQVEKHRNGKAPVTIKACNNERVNSYSDWIPLEKITTTQRYRGGSQSEKDDDTLPF